MCWWLCCLRHRSAVFVLLSVVVATLLLFGGTSATSCPSPCICKWKGGKQTVECVERALITIPDRIDVETQVLDLSSNNLQILPRETFLRSGLTNLQRVFLRSCRLGQIDDVALRGLTNLIELDLSNNLLTAIPSATFQDTPFLRDLVLAGNPIQKIDSLAFKQLPALIKLDVSQCELQVIASRAFDGIELLESLKLNSNRLSELRLRTVETLSRLHAVELHDNPWHCDCRLRAVKEWLVHHNIPSSVAAQCSGGPERLMHKTFTELHVDDFACKPEILPASRYVEAVVGENASIMCRANAVPAAAIRWYWNGRPLTNNSQTAQGQPLKVLILEEGNIQEKRSTLVVTPEHHEMDTTSEFYCVAENRAGSAEANFTVHTSMRAVGITALGGGQIAGLSIALVVLIVFVLLVVSVLLVRLRKLPMSESKTDGHLEIVTTTRMNGRCNSSHSVLAKSPTTPSQGNNYEGPAASLMFHSNSNPTPSNQQPPQSSEMNFYTNPVQKPPRTITEGGGGGSSTVGSPSSINNPDLINDTRVMSSNGPVGAHSVPLNFEDQSRPTSGEYSCNNTDSLYPSSLWQQQHNSDEVDFGRFHQVNSNNNNNNTMTASTASVTGINSGFHYDERLASSSIGECNSSRIDDFHRIPTVNRIAPPPPPYPSDYGLPPSIANAKTIRVWQKGAVPVLPPVTALKRVLTHNRSSPDEGYQEGCGTDV